MIPFPDNSNERVALGKPLMGEMRQQPGPLCQNLPQPAMLCAVVDQLDGTHSSSSVIGQEETGTTNGSED